MFVYKCHASDSYIWILIYCWIVPPRILAHWSCWLRFLEPLVYGTGVIISLLSRYQTGEHLCGHIMEPGLLWSKYYDLLISIPSPNVNSISLLALKFSGYSFNLDNLWLTEATKGTHFPYRFATSSEYNSCRIISQAITQSWVPSKIPSVLRFEPIEHRTYPAIVFIVDEKLEPEYEVVALWIWLACYSHHPQPLALLAGADGDW